ncbi:MAG: peptide chain release factor aRF-1 [Nanoarchaeota archaeon]|nr:peptide chain release factor aRF-1 [Nanoarchaeota archaeon]
MEEEQSMNLERLIEELESYRGRHTELITVYVPADAAILNTIKQIEQEKSTAVNIKSKNTRKNVMDALERISRHLRLFKKTPKNGLAVFCGNISSQEGQPDIKIWSLEPPVPLGVKMYRCDQTFLVEPLREMLQARDVYGLVVIDRKEATIGILEGKSVRKMKHMTSGIPGKMRAGGQSSIRFERNTEIMAVEFYRKVADSMKEIFFHITNLKGILIGGPGQTKEIFIDQGQIMTALKNKIVAVKDVSYTDETGLKELVENSQETLAKEAITQEKELLKTFFTMLATKPEKIAYGEDEVKRALTLGAADKLYISKDLDKYKIDELRRMAADTGAEVFFISTETDEGMQFKNLGGTGAILRYQIG